jgi:hypothetical protein
MEQVKAYAKEEPIMREDGKVYRAITSKITTFDRKRFEADQPVLAEAYLKEGTRTQYRWCKP